MTRRRRTSRKPRPVRHGEYDRFIDRGVMHPYAAWGVPEAPAPVRREPREKEPKPDQEPDRGER